MWSGLCVSWLGPYPFAAETSRQSALDAISTVGAWRPEPVHVRWFTVAGKGRPGPAKGKGGRPRKPIGKGKARADGYERTTVGPKGKGKQVYEHRAVAFGGTPPKGSKAKGTVVDHKNRKRGDNKKTNLRKTSKRGNARNRGGKG